jgi:hypothetical protein
VGARAFEGHPYDGHTLAEQIEQTTILIERASYPITAGEPKNQGRRLQKVSNKSELSSKHARKVTGVGA